jgi:hypothetical protein
MPNISDACVLFNQSFLPSPTKLAFGIWRDNSDPQSRIHNIYVGSDFGFEIKDPKRTFKDAPWCNLDRGVLRILQKLGSISVFQISASFEGGMARF